MTIDVSQSTFINYRPKLYLYNPKLYNIHKQSYNYFYMVLDFFVTLYTLYFIDTLTYDLQSIKS
jgi:hypothetical protein